MTGWFCYLLYIPGTNRTYIGATTDPAHRLRQHNCDIAGGAKATRGHKWTQAFYLSGFPDWPTTLQFEWAWKHQSRGKPGLKGKINGLKKLLELDRPTSKAIPYSLWSRDNRPVTLHATDEQKATLQKIESAIFLLELQHPSNMSTSPQTIESLNTQFTEMATELAIIQKRMADAFKKLGIADESVKDPNTTKKPRNGYLLFSQKIRSEAPAGMKYTAKQMSELWRALPNEERAKYVVDA